MPLVGLEFVDQLRETRGRGRSRVRPPLLLVSLVINFICFSTGCFRVEPRAWFSASALALSKRWRVEKTSLLINTEARPPCNCRSPNTLTGFLIPFVSHEDVLSEICASSNATELESSVSSEARRAGVTFGGSNSR